MPFPTKEEVGGFLSRLSSEGRGHSFFMWTVSDELSRYFLCGGKWEVASGFVRVRHPRYERGVFVIRPKRGAK